MKKTTLFKIVALALIAAFIFPFITACKNDEPTETPLPNQVAPTENMLISGGISEYKIVYPANEQSSIMSFAISELETFWYQATGKRIESIADTGLSHSKNNKYLSMGNTTLLQTANAGFDGSKLSPTGYALITKDSSVFMCGTGVYGVLNAAYSFLSYQFNFECYASDEIALDTGIINKALLNFNIYNNPDITWNAAGAGELQNNTTYTRRLGMNREEDYMIPLGEAFYHNFFGTVPPEQYKADHPEWFSTDQHQLCLTRDPEGLSDVVVAQMKEYITAYPYAYSIGFTQQDVNVWCQCESCENSLQTYGTDSASMIRFINICARKINAWLETAYPGREVYLYIFAYHKTTDAPATYDAASKTYKPNHPSLVLEDNVAVQYAPIYSASYHSYGDLEYNREYDQTLKAWQVLTKNIYLWNYSYHYRHLMLPYFDFYGMQDTFKYMHENSVNYLFDEDVPGTAAWCDWSQLKFYLRAKLGWDVNADMEKLTDDFFVNYFKDASATMRELFDSYSTYYNLLIKDNRLRGQGGVSDTLEPKYWKKATLDGWLELIKQAYRDIEHLKTENPQLYQTLYGRICVESLSYRYLSEYFYDSANYEGNTVVEDRNKYGVNKGL